MKRWLIRLCAALAGLAGLGALAVVTGVLLGSLRMDRRIDQPPYPLALRQDAQAVPEGAYLYRSRGCADCHGADGAGRVFVDGDGLRLAGPNITSGPGSAAAAYRASDWEKALRHGIKPNGRPLRVMPSQDFNRLSDRDLAAIVAFVQQLPPAAGGAAELRLPLIARVLYGFGQIPDAADLIDHRRPPSVPVAAAVTAEHGAYVAQSCVGCHGAALQGGRIPGAPPDWPAAARLSAGAGSVMPLYPDADSLRRMFTSGRRADGSEVRVMPFESLRAMNDTDLQALHLYLHGGAMAPPSVAAE